MKAKCLLLFLIAVLGIGITSCVTPYRRPRPHYHHDHHDHHHRPRPPRPPHHHHRSDVSPWQLERSVGGGSQVIGLVNQVEDQKA